MPLSVSDGMGKWIEDFKTSKAPQFQGKSPEERRDMAIAAFLRKRREGGTNEATDSPPWEGGYKATGPRKDKFGNIIKKKNLPGHLAKKALASVASKSADLVKKARQRDESVEENNSAPQTAAHRRAMMVGVNRDKKVKLKGFGPDGAKGNMGNPSARATLKPTGEAYRPPTQAEIDADKTKDAKRTKSGDAQVYTKSKQYANYMGGLKKESVEQIDEVGRMSPKVGKASYTAPAKELKAYAQKSGGMDKKDFMMVADMLEKLDRINILQAGQLLGQLNAKLKNMDTSPREKVLSVLHNHGHNVGNVMPGAKMRRESVQVDEVSSSVAKRAMKKRVEKQAASYTTQASYNRRADNARAKRDALLKKADALPDHHKPRSSGGDYFKGSSEHEKLTKKADAHNFVAHHYSNKAKEAGERGDKQSNKIGRSQDRAYPKLGKALKANPDNRRANRIGHTQVDKMRDKHFATTTDYNPAGKEKIKGKQHSQYPKEETVLELKKSTLGSYVKKASQDAAAKAYRSAMDANAPAYNPDQRDRSGINYMKSVKRQKGIARATDKLTREGSEERLKMIRQAGEKYNKEKKKAERDAKRAMSKDKDLMGEAKSFDQKFRDHLKFSTSKSPAVQAYLKKRRDDRDARHAKQDPAAVKKNYGPAVIPPGTAYNKASKRGMNPSQAASAVSTAFKNRAKGEKLPK
jgi:hypothetical protein